MEWNLISIQMVVCLGLLTKVSIVRLIQVIMKLKILSQNKKTNLISMT